MRTTRQALLMTIGCVLSLLASVVAHSADEERGTSNPRSETKVEILKPQTKSELPSDPLFEVRGHIMNSEGLHPQLIIVHLMKGKRSYASLSLKLGDETADGTYKQADETKYEFSCKLHTPPHAGKYDLYIETIRVDAKTENAQDFKITRFKSTPVRLVVKSPPNTPEAKP